MQPVPLFQNRAEAGTQLAQALLRYSLTPPTAVFALPRGGVIVAHAISSRFQVPLHVWLTRKLRVPGNPELAMGALSETGYHYLNHDIINSLHISPQQLEEEMTQQRIEIARQARLYRKEEHHPPVEGTTIILVDDGYATGATLLASLASLKHLGVGRLIAALPVAPPQAREDILLHADQACILGSPTNFFAIGQYYRDFSQISDEEVLSCLLP